MIEKEGESSANNVFIVNSYIINNLYFNEKLKLLRYFNLSGINILDFLIKKKNYI